MKSIIISICIILSLNFSAICQDIIITNDDFESLKTYKYGTYIGNNDFLNVRDNNNSFIKGNFNDIYFNKFDSTLSIKGLLYESPNDFNGPLKYFVILSGIFEIDTSLKNNKIKNDDSDSTNKNDTPKNKRGVENIVSKTPGILMADKFITNTIYHFKNTAEFKIKIKIKIKSVNDILCFASEVEPDLDNEHNADRNDNTEIVIKNKSLFFEIGKLIK